MQTGQDHPVTICRKIAFSCGHRYHQPQWDEGKNRSVFGSLYSSHGFGHNFILEAYVEGKVDPQTGMVINLRDLDKVLKEVVHPLDHHFLNHDVEYFGDHVPTTENIAAFCFREITRRMNWEGIRLKKVRLYEGDDLWVEVHARSADRG